MVRAMSTANDPKALARLSKSGERRPVWLVQGAERLMVDEAVRQVLASAVDDPADTMAVTRIDLTESGRDARAVLGACRSINLFGGRTAVLVRGADQLDKDAEGRDQVAEYVARPNPHCTLILVADKLLGTTKLYKELKRSGEILAFDPLKDREVPGWLMDEARRQGHRMDSGTARLVADLTGTDLQQLRLVVDQLSLYVGPGQPITEDAVEAVLAATRAHGIFELMDAVGERRTAQALAHVHSMLEHRQPALMILGMLTRHVRMLWQIAAARAAGHDLDAATRLLKVHPFQAKKLWAQSTKFQRATLRAAYERLYESDLRLKSSGVDDAIVMERLVMDLCR